MILEIIRMQASNDYRFAVAVENPYQSGTCALKISLRKSV